MKAVQIKKAFSGLGWIIHWYDPLTRRTKGMAVARCFEEESDAVDYAKDKGIDPSHIYTAL